MTVKLVCNVVHARNVPAWNKTNHVFTICESKYETGLYVVAEDYGCSPVYNTTSEYEALRLFLNEHACMALNTRRL